MITNIVRMTIQGEETILTNKSLISLDLSIIDRGDMKLPSFGIISNSGNISFNDVDLSFLEFAQKGYLIDNIDVIIEVQNTLNKSKKIIATLKSNSWFYDNDNRQVNVSLKDDLEAWQDIQTQDKKLSDTMSGIDVYNYLRDITPSNWQFEELDNSTQGLLNTYKILYPYILSGTLWQQWTKFCEAFGVHIFKNSQAKIVIRVGI